MWAERPAAEWIHQMAVVRVMYLLELRVRLMEKMLTDFIDGVDIFLSLHRDANAATLSHLQVDVCCIHRPLARKYLNNFVIFVTCFDAVGWATGRASGL